MGCFQTIFERENGPLRHSGNGPLRSENGPLRRGNGPLRLMGCFGHPAMLEICGAFVEFSWLPISLFVNIRGIFVDPPKSNVAALSVGFHGLFVEVGALPAGENTRKPTTLESTGQNIFLSQAPPPQPDCHARGQ